MHRRVCCGEAEAWRKEIPERLPTPPENNYYPEALGLQGSPSCIPLPHRFGITLRKGKRQILPREDPGDLHPLCISLCAPVEREEGLILEWNLRSLKPGMCQRTPPRVFAILQPCAYRMRWFMPWWRFWQHVSTDIKVMMSPGSSAFSHALEMVKSSLVQLPGEVRGDLLSFSTGKRWRVGYLLSH